MGEFRKLIDETGNRYGRWLVIGPYRRKFYRRKKYIKRASITYARTLWKCLCDCGSIGWIDATSLRNGLRISCGCYHREVNHKVQTTHGQANVGKITTEYRCWQALKRRCYNRRHESYQKYGARGITVCERWRNSFENFFADMGPRPEGKTIDRIDNDGPYAPENCRWATPKQQSANQRKRRIHSK